MKTEPAAEAWINKDIPGGAIGPPLAQSAEMKLAHLRAKAAIYAIRHKCSATPYDAEIALLIGPPQYARKVRKRKREPKTAETFSIYVAECGQFVKIGLSRNVPRRLKALRTTAPAPIKLLATFPGSTDAERKLHARFASYRTSGEWFANEGEVAEWIGTLPAPPPEK